MKTLTLTLTLTVSVLPRHLTEAINIVNKKYSDIITVEYAIDSGSACSSICIKPSYHLTADSVWELYKECVLADLLNLK